MESNYCPKVIAIQGGFPALSATFILDQITGLLDRGLSLENWSTYDPQDNKIHPSVEKYNLREQTRYISCPPDSLRCQPESWTEAFMELNGIQDFDSVKVFHVHYGANFNLLMPLFQTLKQKVVVSFHGYDATRYIKANGSQCYDFLYDRAEIITAPSDYLKACLIKSGCPPRKVNIHRYGVDLTRFSNVRSEAETDGITILTVGRLVEKKGIEYSLRAFANLPKSLNANYRIIGDGDRREQLQKLTKLLRIEDRVTFLGAQPQDVILEEMTRASIFMLTSVTAVDGDMEGLPVVLIEAHAMGLPIVSTYHSGIPELALHQQTALLAKERDVEEISRHLERLATNKNLRSKLATNARVRVEDEFDIQKLNDRLCTLLVGARADSLKLNIVTELTRTVVKAVLQAREFVKRWAA